MDLTQEEKAMARGAYGNGIKKCMDILIKVGEAAGAPKMVKIASAHIMPKEPIGLLEEMTEDVNAPGVFTTVHAKMSAFDPECWKQMGVRKEYFKNELPQYIKRQEIYRRIGFYQTYTCLPMLVGNLPRYGDYISWTGSGAQLLANSLLGARTNRDGAVVTLASAITGRTPYCGLMRDENRLAEVVVELNGLNCKNLTHTDLGAIGYYVGEIAGNRNVVVNGMPKEMDIDQLKYLMAPLSTSGSVSVCHIVGITPEANRLEMAIRPDCQPETISVDVADIIKTKQFYTGEEKVDMALFGCPHVTISELKTMAALLENKTIDPGKRVWVGMPHQTYSLAQQMGYIQLVENAGAVVSSSCMATIPDSPLPEGVHTLATNSFKAAHYITRLTKGAVRCVIADMEDCIASVTSKTK